MFDVFKNIIFISTVFSILTIARLGYAADNGDTDVSAEVPIILDISGVDNLNFGVWDGTEGNVTVEDPDGVCVFTNNAAGYTIRLTGDGSTSNLYMYRSSGGSLLWYIKFDESPGVTYNQASYPLSRNQTTAAITGTDMTVAGCNGGSNASLTGLVGGGRLNDQAGDNITNFIGNFTLTIAAV